MLEFEIEESVQGLLAGIVAARGLTVGPASAELREACAGIVSQVLKDGMGGGEPRRESVRRLLRAGGFRPSGRNKPAQEYLLRTVAESRELPSIFGPVDWLNAISLRSGLPISLLSASRLGPLAVIRYGRAGEKFTFNRTGQELDLDGLICVCAGNAPHAPALGTPVKDSMAGKIGEQDSDMIAVLYAPQSAMTSDELGGWCDQLGQGLTRFCGAASFELAIRNSTN